MLEEFTKIHKGKKAPTFNTETMLDISEIQHDTIILKDGGLRGIVKVSWLNIDLKNNDEIEIIISQYKKFLNWLDFPIQILVRNTYLDFWPYVNYMHEQVKDITNKKLAQYADDYTTFLEHIQKKTHLIFSKEFYIIVPYYGSLKAEQDAIKRPRWQKILDVLSGKFGAEQIVQNYRSYLANKKHLDTRCNQIISQMKSLKMTAHRLWLSDIVGLLFQVYNPTVNKEQA